MSNALVDRPPGPPAPPAPSASPVRADAEAVAIAARAVAGVVRLAAGPRGDVRTHLAGRRVDGVRLRHDGVEVRVVAEVGVASLPSVATAVRHAVRASFPGACVHVVIDDLAPPETGAGDEAGAVGTGAVDEAAGS